MRDPYIDKLAQVIVRYSTNVQPGQLVRISADPVATPLVEALYEQVIRARAHAYVKMAPDGLSEIFYELADDTQLQYVSPLARHEVETIDVSIGLWAETNTKRLSRTDPRRQGMASAARRPIMETFMRRAAAGQLKWSGTLYPTLASAQDAEMSLRQYERFVFEAGHLHESDPVAVWQRIHGRQQKLADYLQGRKQVRFQAANGTDLTVNVEGMNWINCAGHENFPDGEVFTGPNLKAADGGVNGYVKYSFPAVHGGHEVHDVELTFEKGRVVKAEASKGRDFLIQMLDQDAGARAVGEIAIGTNYQIQRYSKNTLFDEKIGGTFHLAVGSGYHETGNTNASGLHWDMVCDLRSPANGGVEKAGGTITVDGEVISRDGRFLFDDWPGPA